MSHPRKNPRARMRWTASPPPATAAAPEHGLCCYCHASLNQSELPTTFTFASILASPRVTPVEPWHEMLPVPCREPCRHEVLRALRCAGRSYLSVVRSHQSSGAPFLRSVRRTP